MNSGLFGRTSAEVTEAIKDLNLTPTTVKINQVESDGFEKICKLDGDCDLTYVIANDM